MSRHYTYSCGNYPLDSSGNKIELGSRVAFNRSGKVMGGVVIKTEWSQWSQSYAYDYSKGRMGYIDVRYPVVYIKSILDDKVSKVKNTNGIYVI